MATWIGGRLVTILPLITGWMAFNRVGLSGPMLIGIHILSVELLMILFPFTKLSHAFGMEVVAEGMETLAQEQVLRELGCDYLQGYLISRPMPPQDLPNFLNNFLAQPKQA